MPEDAQAGENGDGGCAARRRGLEQSPDRFSTDAAVEFREQASNLLDAIESGATDANFLPDTALALNRLAELTAGSPDPEWAVYLHRAKTFSAVETAAARSHVRTVIRLCRGLLERELVEVPGLAELRCRYIVNKRADTFRLRRALGNSQFEVVREAGHTLQGTGTSFGFGELTEIGRGLESAAQAKDVVAAEIQMERMSSYFAIVYPPAEP